MSNHAHQLKPLFVVFVGIILVDGVFVLGVGVGAGIRGESGVVPGVVLDGTTDVPSLDIFVQNAICIQELQDEEQDEEQDELQELEEHDREHELELEELELEDEESSDDDDVEDSSSEQEPELDEED